ncbi:GSCOCG00007632001-RA-CDS [Cotesia congregata]|nr:GSCOCG00007632001-RA-CDS [Cotesia congregata]
MTVITKAIGEKKPVDKMEQPLMHRFRTGWYSIPYERMDNKLPFVSDELSAGVPSDSDLFKSLARDTEQEALVLDRSAQNTIRNFFQDSSKDFFQECFEMDLENGHYEGIEVPDFRDGRQGRFIHDFNINLTGIIDLDGHSCFVMALDRDKVLPPKNMYDLLNKMYNGYYEVNTKVVRETMKAVFPAICDRSTVGTYIARECKQMPIYTLEKVNNTAGIVKRSIDGVIFGHFAGTNIIEYDISNMAEVQEETRKDD